MHTWIQGHTLIHTYARSHTHICNIIYFKYIHSTHNTYDYGLACISVFGLASNPNGQTGGAAKGMGWRQQVLEMKRAMGIWPDYKCCAIAQTWLKKLYHTKMVFDSKWITSVGDLRKSSEFFLLLLHSSSFAFFHIRSLSYHFSLRFEYLDWKRIYTNS